MKKIPLLLFAFVATVLITSCYSKEDNEDEIVNAESTKQSVKIITRTTSGSNLQYPIEAVALDNQGQEKARQTLTSDADNLLFKLPQGSYRIVAYSGELEMPESGYAVKPTMMGAADIVVDNSKISANLMLSYMSSSITMELGGIPLDATAVSLTISPLYHNLFLNGNYDDVGTATIALTKKESLWVSGLFYVFPSSGQQTSFSIHVTTPAGTQVYGYTYAAPLRAATPYILSGTYDSGNSLISGILSSAQWNDEVNIDFSFGENIETPTEEETPNPALENPDIDLSKYIAVFKNEEENQIIYTLISSREYINVLVSDAASLASAYKEGDLSGWYIPTEVEARALKDYYSDANLDNLNARIIALGGTSISVTNSKGEPYRYLCENASKTFVFTTSSSVTKSGATVKYSLRLLKKVVVKKK